MSWSGCSATSGSRLFISMRMAASCAQPWQLSWAPRGARTGSWVMGPSWRGANGGDKEAGGLLGSAAVQRVSMVGISGSGKSTLGRELTRILGLPHLELDSVFHQAGWVSLSDEERSEEHTSELQSLRHL